MRKFLVILLCLVSFLVVSCSSEPTLDNQKAYAWTAAQREVKERLKSPSSAKFPTYNSNKVKLVEGDTFEVTGYVDAQNSFGAMIRTNYTAKIKVNYEKETYSVLSFQMQ